MRPIAQVCHALQVFYYSDAVFRSANVPAERTQYATLGCGGILVLMTIISVSCEEHSLALGVPAAAPSLVFGA